MDHKDLDAAGALFSSTSSLYETGSQEGAWSHYRAHHLGPEAEQFASFTTNLGEPEQMESVDSSLVVVAWPLSYRIVLADERVIDSVATTTFVMQRLGDSYKIRHLHWSSHPKR